MTDSPTESPAGWHPDPQCRHEIRYWDGAKWTDHVSDAGVTAKDPVTPKKSFFARLESAVTVGDDQSDAAKDKVRGQVDGEGRFNTGVQARTDAGGGSLFTEKVLVVNQKTKIIELSNQYSVYDQDGNVLATVNQVGQSSLKQAARLVSSLDQFMTHKLEITDPSGQVLLRLTRPKKIIKSSMIVSDADDNEIGRIVQRKALGKIRFALESDGKTVGMVKAENWKAWNFRIEDVDDKEVARITKTFEGILRTAFTSADNYVVQIHEDLPEPLHSLVVAAAVSVDTALKQDDRGLN